MDPGSDHILLCRLPGRTQRSGPQRWAVLLTYLIAPNPVNRLTVEATRLKYSKSITSFTII